MSLLEQPSRAVGIPDPLLEHFFNSGGDLQEVAAMSNSNAAEEFQFVGFVAEKLFYERRTLFKIKEKYYVFHNSQKEHEACPVLAVYRMSAANALLFYKECRAQQNQVLPEFARAFPMMGGRVWSVKEA